MVFFSSGNSTIPTFTYDSTPLELVTEFKYLGITLTRDGSMITATKKQLQVCHCQSLQNWWQQGYQAQKTCHAMAFPGLCFDSWSLRLSSMGHFFSDIWFLKNQPHTCPSSWFPEKTPGCASRKALILTACSAKRVRCPFFLLVQMHHTILEQFTLLNNPLLEKVVQTDLLTAKKSDQVLSHSKISLHLSNFLMPYDLANLSI